MKTRSRCTFAVVLLAVVWAGGCRSGGAGDKNDVIVANGERDTERALREHERSFQLIRERKYDEAEKACKRALRADIMFGPAHNNLGLVYYHQGKLYAAAWEFQNAIKLMPYQPEPRNNLGLVFERAGKTSAAAEAGGAVPSSPRRDAVAVVVCARVFDRLLVVVPCVSTTTVHEVKPDERRLFSGIFLQPFGFIERV